MQMFYSEIEITAGSWFHLISHSLTGAAPLLICSVMVLAALRRNKENPVFCWRVIPEPCPYAVFMAVLQI